MKHLLTALVFILAILPAGAQRTYWQHLRQQWPALAASTIAGAANGTGDVLQFWYSSSRFPQSGPARQFWDPDLSWRNKWRTGPDGELIRPLQEKFWGSSRWFVGLTDGWHPTKSIQLAAQYTAVVTYKPEPLYHISWHTGQQVATRAKWWWKPADYLILRAAFATGWHLSTRALRHP